MKLRRVILAIMVLSILTWVGYVWLVTGRWPDWTGFSTKTLWDFMELLIIPVVLAGGAYWLNESACQREREIAEQNRQETALQAYLDKMTELPLDKNLRESEQESRIRAVMRARTLAVLRKLDKYHKRALLQFLYEADLIDKDKIVINLRWADLRWADLSGAILIRANLVEADLREADLSKVNLSGADLRGTYLFMAILSGADLSKANLSKVNLGGAYLIEADLNGADLSHAWLSGADLSGAILSGANMRNANLSKAKLSRAKYTKNTNDIIGTIWPDGFDPEKAGAICVNE